MKLDLVAVGEFYTDLIFHQLDRVPRLGEELRSRHFARSVGGGAAITAVAARRLGLRVGLVTVVGQDADLEPVRAEKIDTSHSRTDPRKRSPLTVAVSTRRDRCFLTYEGANVDFDRLIDWDRLWAYLEWARHVHFAFCPNRLKLVTQQMRCLGSAGITTSVDFGWKPELATRRGFWEWLGSATIFFPNLMEARALTGERRAERALAALADRVPLPVVKMGARGAMAWDRGRVVRVAAPRVRAVDSTGAGDAFDAGFLHGYLGRRPLEECLRWGNYCGALSTTAAGGIAGLPRRKPLRRPGP